MCGKRYREWWTVTVIETCVDAGVVVTLEGSRP